MAEIITIEGQEYKIRNPWGAWGWSFLIIPYYVWYFRLNDEARRYLKDESISPGLATLAQVVPIVHWISIWRTGDRISRMQQQAGLEPTVQPILGLLASLFAALHVVYYQSELNKVWGAVLARGAVPGAGAGTGSSPAGAAPGAGPVTPPAPPGIPEAPPPSEAPPVPPEPPPAPPDRPSTPTE